LTSGNATVSRNRRPFLQAGDYRIWWTRGAFGDHGRRSGAATRLDHPESFVCGDTYGSLIASLKHFFPIETVPSSLRNDILDENGVARDVAIYFLQRQVLGSFESADDFIEAINFISNCNPKIAHRILALMEAGLKKMGITSLQNFDAKKFKIDFFYFPLHHEQTVKGLNRLEKVILKLAAHQPRSPY